MFYRRIEPAAMNSLQLSKTLIMNPAMKCSTYLRNEQRVSSFSSVMKNFMFQLRMGSEFISRVKMNLSKKCSNAPMMKCTSTNRLSNEI